MPSRAWLPSSRSAPAEDTARDWTLQLPSRTAAQTCCCYCHWHQVPLLLLLPPRLPAWQAARCLGSRPAQSAPTAAHVPAPAAPRGGPAPSAPRCPCPRRRRCCRPAAGAPPPPGSHTPGRSLPRRSPLLRAWPVRLPILSPARCVIGLLAAAAVPAARRCPLQWPAGCGHPCACTRQGGPGGGGVSMHARMQVGARAGRQGAFAWVTGQYTRALPGHRGRTRPPATAGCQLGLTARSRWPSPAAPCCNL